MKSFESFIFISIFFACFSSNTDSNILPDIGRWDNPQICTTEDGPATSNFDCLLPIMAYLRNKIIYYKKITYFQYTIFN